MKSYLKDDLELLRNRIKADATKGELEFIVDKLLFDLDDGCTKINPFNWTRLRIERDSNDKLSEL